MTKDEWITHLSNQRFLMDKWEDENSYEIYPTTEVDKAIGKPELWNKTYFDDCGPLWCLHLYAYIQKDNSVEYQAWLYTDVEKGDNEPYELTIPFELKEALDFLVLRERAKYRR